MANRHGDFNELLASQFKDVEFGQIYFVNLINLENMELSEALRETIIAMGLKAFADKIGVSVQYVSDFINRRKKLSTDTIGKYLKKAFNLKLKISVEVIETEVA